MGGAWTAVQPVAAETLPGRHFVDDIDMLATIVISGPQFRLRERRAQHISAETP
jgi:hypothetical protein